MPGGTFCVMNATCSVSAKKLSGMRSSTSRPTGIGGEHLFGNELGRIEHVEVEAVGELLVEQLDAAAPIPGNCRTGWRPTDRGDGSPDRRR